MADNCHLRSIQVPAGRIDLSFRFRLHRRLAELPWKPSSEWYGQLLMAPLALAFGAYWSVRKLIQHASGVFGLGLLGAVAYGLFRLEMFQGVDLWIVFAIAALGGLIAIVILLDWYREKLQYSALFRRRDDPRQDVARRRFRVVCEHASFSPSAWHAGYDNDMFGIGVELYLRRLMIWKHGRAYIFPLDACEFAHRGTELYVKVAHATEEGVPEVLQFRVSCQGGRRAPREWVKLLKRAARRHIAV